ncbi:ethanolaminephosphotransferase 1-like [Lytechinus pictus]|uniref:ethanolaminephosphotransferase 1-like n=1 Tax=Lytechinus pictus TaxID=7653 RepID=UPI0030BA1F8C
MAIIYLNNDQIKGFDKYKYSSLDTSPLATYVLHPVWNALVKLFPMWLAPNLMTFIGFLFFVCQFLLVAYYDWDFCGSNRTKVEYPTIPGWVWFVAGICQLAGHSLDGLDGKQARRTGSSTPLGELFDHGSDSILCGLMPIAALSVYGKGWEDYGGSSWIFFVAQWHITGAFFLSHWEKYLTGVFYLPWSSDSSQLCTAIVYLLTGIFGYEVWKVTLPLGIQFNYLFLAICFEEITFFGFAFIVMLAGVFFLSLPLTLYNIYRSYRDGTGKNRCFSEAMWPLVPMIILFLASLFWGIYSPTNILEYHTRIFLLTFSAVFSNITVRLIISQMSDTLASTNNSLLMLYGVAAFAVCVLGLAEYEVRILHGLFVVIELLHFHYLVSVVNQLCDHFNVYAFSITSRPRQKNNDN